MQDQGEPGELWQRLFDSARLRHHVKTALLWDLSISDLDYYLLAAGLSPPLTPIEVFRIGLIRQLHNYCGLPVGEGVKLVAAILSMVEPPGVAGLVFYAMPTRGADWLVRETMPEDQPSFCVPCAPLIRCILADNAAAPA